MLTLVINLGGQAQVVTIAEALYLLVVELYQPVRPGIAVDEDEMRPWLRWLLERDFNENAARLWLSRIGTAYACGVTNEVVVDASFPTFTSGIRSELRQAFRELDEFRRLM